MQEKRESGKFSHEFSSLEEKENAFPFAIIDEEELRFQFSRKHSATNSASRLIRLTRTLQLTNIYTEKKKWKN